jgi:hypothetical protein
MTLSAILLRATAGSFASNEDLKPIAWQEIARGESCSGIEPLPMIDKRSQDGLAPARRSSARYKSRRSCRAVLSGAQIFRFWSAVPKGTPRRR